MERGQTALAGGRARRSANVRLTALAGALLLAGAGGFVAASVPRVQAAVPADAVAAGAAAAGGSYAPVVDRVAPAVVTVRSERTVRVAESAPFEEFFGRRFGQPREAPERRGGGLGSGVVVTGDGYVLTNHHVIEGARRIEVEMTDGRTFEAELVGSDPPSDLAVLKVDARGLQTVRLGNSDAVRVGDVVLAVGNPLGVGQTVTLGIVSAKGRATGLGSGSFEDFIQTDAPINRGNSGGALVNTNGELVGINSQILSPSGGNIGIGFAIPANMAREVMDQLVDTGAVRRGMIGVTVQAVDSDLAASLGLGKVQGALVSSVQAGSPAEQAGFRRGDVVLEIDGAPVTDSNGLRNQVARTGPGRQVSFKVLRDGRERTLTARLAELPQEREREDTRAARRGGDESGGYGLSVQPLTREAARRLGVQATGGVAITEVDPSSPAADAGLRAGDVIEEVNRRPVNSVRELREALRASRDRPALVLVHREGNSLYVPLRPPRA